MFYYQKGNIGTSTPWHRPSIDSFNNWLNVWRNSPGLKNYDVFLVGGFCQHYCLGKEIATWDVDIILMGEVKNKPHLKNILNQAVKLGFDNRLLIDIAWRGGLPGDTIWSRDKIINYTYIRKQTNTENWMIEVSETSTIETLINGLYKCTLNDTLSAESKFKDKKYELNYKKLEL